MRLGYYKLKIKQSLSSIFRHYHLRKRMTIGKSCLIGENSKLENGISIRDYVTISDTVELGKNAIVGSHAKLSNILVGENTHIESGVLCTGYGNGKIEIGKECYIGINNILDWSDNIIIGDYVHIAGPSTGLWTHSSVNMCLNGDKLNNKTLKNRPTDPIRIEHNVYIGGNCSIYPGVVIGHHSIITPNSAVVEDVEPYSMVGGVPARLIKKLNNLNA